MPTQTVSFKDASERLHYDPATGSLRWTKDHPYAKAGSLAGTVLANGYVSVTFNGAKILGHYLAWLLHTGKWPEGRLRLKSASKPGLTEEQKLCERGNLKFENIVPAGQMLSVKPASVKRRAYARDKARARREEALYRAVTAATTYPNVMFSKDHRAWLVGKLYSLNEERSPFHQVQMQGKPFEAIAAFPDQFNAEHYAHQMNLNRKLIQDKRTGEDAAPEPLPPGAGSATAGVMGPTLNDLYLALAYDHERGVIFWRTGDKRYQDAATPTSGRTSYIQFRNWRLPAHSVAFFLAKGVWPLRGTLHPFDGNWRNLKLHNLRYDRAEMTTYPLEAAQP